MIKLIDFCFNATFGRFFSNSVHQFFRYLFCGAMATLADISILFVLTYFFHFNHLVAAAFGFAAGVITNYTLNISLVFQSSGKKRKEFPMFALVGIGGLAWTEIILWILVDNLNTHLAIAKAVAVVLVLAWNFFMRKKFVFHLGSKLKTKN